MRLYRYEQSLAELFSDPMPIVFLVGPTVRGHQQHLTSWRPAAVAEFEEQGFDGSLIIPEFTVPTESDKGKLWIPAWEFAGLNVADVNMTWIPRTRELIGLTTNHEQGYWLAKNHRKLLYGRPDDAYRITYNDLMQQFDAEQEGYAPEPTYSDLHDLVKMTIWKATCEIHRHRVKSRVAVDSPYGPFKMSDAK